VDCAAGPIAIRAPAFIVLLMVPFSSLRVVSSQFAEEGVYSQQRQHLGLILTNQLEELLFDYCPGKNIKPQCIMKLKRLNFQPENTPFMGGLKFMVAIFNLCYLKHEE
jgi:hypothetical protein